jgi:hypothetical protein
MYTLLNNHTHVKVSSMTPPFTSGVEHHRKQTTPKDSNPTEKDTQIKKAVAKKIEG